MLKVKKGNDELRVTFPPGGHINHETVRLYDDRCFLGDKPVTDKQIKQAEKVVALYSLFVFQ